MIRKEIGRLGKNIMYGPRLARMKKNLTAENITREAIVDKATKYVMSCQIKGRGMFGFTSHTAEPDLYSTAYAVNYLGLVGRLNLLNNTDRRNIIDYFNSHQDFDGLYRSSNLVTPASESGQGWGVMHLLPHIIIALDYLHDRPKTPFHYLYDIFNDCDPETWVDKIFAKDILSASNYFMNVVVALQYSRDFMNDTRSEEILTRLIKYTNDRLLIRLIDSGNVSNVLKRSEAVKTIYHLLPGLIYDKSVLGPLKGSILDMSIKTQNNIGGYGVSTLSNACEDMDSIYNIAMISYKNKKWRSLGSLQKSLQYIPINQNDDGGFVFQRFYSFCYGGCETLSSGKNESNMFATWFRVLGYAFADVIVNDNAKDWYFSRIPGYQWCAGLE